MPDEVAGQPARPVALGGHDHEAACGGPCDHRTPEHGERALDVGGGDDDPPGAPPDLVERLLEHQLPVVHDADPRAQRLDLGEQVAGEEHRGALLVQLDQQLADLPDAVRVQAVGGLVEDQQVGGREQRAREPQPLAHAQRVGAHRAAVDAGEPDPLEGLPHPPPPSRPAAGAGRVEQVEVRPPGEVAVRGGALDHRPDARQHRVDLARHLPAEHPDVAARGVDQPEQHPHQRRLARAVRAEEAVAVAPGDVQVDVVDGGVRPVALGQPAGLDHQRGVDGGCAERARRGPGPGAALGGQTVPRGRGRAGQAVLVAVGAHETLPATSSTARSRTASGTSPPIAQARSPTRTTASCSKRRGDRAALRAAVLPARRLRGVDRQRAGRRARAVDVGEQRGRQVRGQRHHDQLRQRRAVLADGGEPALRALPDDVVDAVRDGRGVPAAEDAEEVGGRAAGRARAGAGLRDEDGGVGGGLVEVEHGAHDDGSRGQLPGLVLRAHLHGHGQPARGVGPHVEGADGGARVGDRHPEPRGIHPRDAAGGQRDRDVVTGGAGEQSAGQLRGRQVVGAREAHRRVAAHEGEQLGAVVPHRLAVGGRVAVPFAGRVELVDPARVGGGIPDAQA